MAKTQIRRIDELLGAAAGIPAIVPNDGDEAAVGAVQELLRSHGYTRLPDMRNPSYGKFGPLTAQCVAACRADAGLDGAPRVDRPLLDYLLRRDPPVPIASRTYLAYALDLEYTPLLGAVAVCALCESGGRFACLNLNTDKCGLSFGIIQWAQRPGRLHGILAAFRRADPAAMREIAGSEAALDGLLAHTAKPNGGVNPATGETLDARFDLIREPWKSRFERMGKTRSLQKAQVEDALAAFRASLDRLQAEAPGIGTERGYAFLLDLANQHGDGGARSILRTVTRPGMGETQLLESMERESVRRVAAQYGPASAEAASTANRRKWFRTVPWLSDAAGAAV